MDMRFTKINPEKGKILSYAVMDEEDYSRYPFFSFTGTKESDYIDISEVVFKRYLEDRGFDGYSLMPIHDVDHMKEFVIDVQEVDIDPAIRLGFGVVEVEGKRYLFDTEDSLRSDNDYMVHLFERLAIYHFVTMGLFRDRIAYMEANDLIRLYLYTHDYLDFEHKIRVKLAETGNKQS